MNYIHGKCSTTIDGLKDHQWPEVFVALPRIGDQVESKKGKILYVRDVVHTMAVGEHPLDGEHPTVRIELGLKGP